jgi:antirestriction protein ArdC
MAVTERQLASVIKNIKTSGGVYMSQGTEKRREELAKRVAISLEAGVIPWQRYGLPLSPPTNAVTGRSYKGVNALFLMERCAENGYTDNRWITASDANKHGFLIKNGEQGAVLEHWGENKDGKMTVKGYPVFNVSQLNAYIPLPENERLPDLSRADAMMRKAGIEIRDKPVFLDYLEKIQTYTLMKTNEQCQSVYTNDLKTLRYSMALSTVCREMGLDSGMPLGAPTKSWANSISHNPKELFSAARDASKSADSILKEMQYERNTVQNMNLINWDVIQERMQQAREAQQEKAEAQRIGEIVEDAALIPDGLDSNLPNADLNYEQEAVKSSVDKAVTEVKEMRNAATMKEANAQGGIAGAAAIAKEKMGKGAIVTSAKPGRSYSGKIIGIVGAHPDTIAIQRISGNQAVLHRIKEKSAEANMAIGADVTITKGQDGKTEVKARDESTRERDTRENEREGRVR